MVLLTEKHLVGIVANGVVSAVNRADPITSVVTGSLAIEGDLHNPLSYLKERYLARVKDVDLLGPELRKSNRANFCVAYEGISQVSYDPRKKWGMASYSHDGKIYITVLDRRREFIVLGSQSGQAILKWIEQRMVETTPGALSGSHEPGA